MRSTVSWKSNVHVLLKLYDWHNIRCMTRALTHEMVKMLLFMIWASLSPLSNTGDFDDLETHTRNITLGFSLCRRNWRGELRLLVISIHCFVRNMAGGILTVLVHKVQAIVIGNYHSH